MAPQYSVGDVIIVAYPNDDLNGPPTKDRPVLIVDILSHEEVLVACITKQKYHVGINKGHWIEANSENGKKMKLRQDSFINLDDIKPLKFYFIKHRSGTCPIIEKILEEINLL